MAARYPDVQVLKPQLEGFDPAQAVSKAVSILQSDDKINAAYSTTGGGPVTWAGAQDQAGRRLAIIGMDYTRPNLDLIRAGKIFGIVAQPIYEEHALAVDALKEKICGGTPRAEVTPDSPIVTRANLAEVLRPARQNGDLSVVRPRGRARRMTRPRPRRPLRASAHDPPSQHHSTMTTRPIHSDSAAPEFALELEQITKRFGGVTALQRRDRARAPRRGARAGRRERRRQVDAAQGARRPVPERQLRRPRPDRRARRSPSTRRRTRARSASRSSRRRRA